jgi:ABC-type multidrug transport system ATPase subunit
MSIFEINATKIAKTFDHRKYIFIDLDFNISSGKIKGITGPNGSGKTTLVKTLCGSYSPDKGKIKWNKEGKDLKEEEYQSHFGLVSPYLTLYEEYTPEEHLRIFAELRGIPFNAEKCDSLLKQFAVEHQKFAEIKKFSSGQKQRMKYVLALQHSPEILFLDEPMSNLDTDGIEIVREMISDHVSSGGCVVVATNDEQEKKLCSEIINLTDYK